MEKIILIRHAEAYWKKEEPGKPVLLPSSRKDIKNKRKWLQNMNYDLSAVASSPVTRAKLTADGLADDGEDGVKKYPILNQLRTDGYTRPELIAMASSSRVPDGFLQKGGEILDNLPPEQVCVTHGSVLAAVWVAAIERGLLDPPKGWPGLIVRNLGHLTINR
jgi:hypothetical protein